MPRRGRTADAEVKKIVNAELAKIVADIQAGPGATVTLYMLSTEIARRHPELRRRYNSVADWQTAVADAANITEAQGDTYAPTGLRPGAFTEERRKQVVEEFMSGGRRGKADAGTDARTDARMSLDASMTEARRQQVVAEFVGGGRGGKADGAALSLGGRDPELTALLAEGEALLRQLGDPDARRRQQAEARRQLCVALSLGVIPARSPGDEAKGYLAQMGDGIDRSRAAAVAREEMASSGVRSGARFATGGARLAIDGASDEDSEQEAFILEQLRERPDDDDPDDDTPLTPEERERLGQLTRLAAEDLRDAPRGSPRRQLLLSALTAARGHEGELRQWGGWRGLLNELQDMFGGGDQAGAPPGGNGGNAAKGNGNRGGYRAANGVMMPGDTRSGTVARNDAKARAMGRP
jgi:hypothetical protein